MRCSSEVIGDDRHTAFGILPTTVLCMQQTVFHSLLLSLFGEYRIFELSEEPCRLL